MAEQTFAEQIQRLRELEAKATPAPWYWLPAVLDASEEGTLASLESKAGQTVCDFGSRHSFDHAPGDEPSPADQELIALSRNLLPSLLVEREALRETLATETAAYESMKKAYEIVTGQREEMQKRIKELEAERYLLAQSIDSASKAIAFSSADWGAEKRHAWVYGILCGWDGDGPDSAMNEVARKFGWNDLNVARLRMYHGAIAKLKAGEGGKPDGD